MSGLVPNIYPQRISDRGGAKGRERERERERREREREREREKREREREEEKKRERERERKMERDRQRVLTDHYDVLSQVFFLVKVVFKLDRRHIQNEPDSATDSILKRTISGFEFKNNDLWRPILENFLNFMLT